MGRLLFMEVGFEVVEPRDGDLTRAGAGVVAPDVFGGQLWIQCNFTLDLGSGREHFGIWLQNLGQEPLENLSIRPTSGFRFGAFGGLVEPRGLEPMELFGEGVARSPASREPISADVEFVVGGRTVRDHVRREADEILVWTEPVPAVESPVDVSDPGSRRVSRRLPSAGLRSEPLEVWFEDHRHGHQLDWHTVVVTRNVSSRTVRNIIFEQCSGPDLDAEIANRCRLDALQPGATARQGFWGEAARSADGRVVISHDGDPPVVRRDVWDGPDDFVCYQSGVHR